jgi:23S rRNA pseudouridine1911/1915/1917 synthase
MVEFIYMPESLALLHPVTKEAIEIIAPTNPQDKIWQACEK